MILAAVSFLALNARVPQTKPVPSCAEVIAQAAREAKRQKKKVYAVVTASWCKPCHVYTEKFLADPAVRKVLDRYFVFTTLNAFETEKTGHLENPGTREWLPTVGGEKAGLPYWAILDGNGKFVRGGWNGSIQLEIPSNTLGINAYLATLVAAEKGIRDSDLWALRSAIEAYNERESLK